mgnify:CR=1 FL=1
MSPAEDVLFTLTSWIQLCWRFTFTFTNCCLLQHYTTITPQDGGWVRVTFTKSSPEAAFEDYCLCTGEVLRFRFRFISLFTNWFINIGGCQDWCIGGEDKKSCSCLEPAYTCSLNKLSLAESAPSWPSVGGTLHVAAWVRACSS